ncbi:MAG: pilus assembly protein CpaB [Psychromonas sp.]|jgi:pilus assembly protein CpaB|uniref:Flp pilus assembly protein CpaB n=1 Tax=Psychromonas sp. TaxID=1884585 RepID=UPI0039E23DD7
MNRNTLVFIVLSIAFGLGAVLIARNWLAENKPENVTAGQVAAFTVNAELPTGAILDPKYIVSTVIPESLVTEGTITDRKQLQEMVVKQRLFKGDILRQERLVKKGEGSSLASLIGKNMRAVSIRVNDVVGVAGFLLPGNKVDVLSTHQTKDKNASTEVILSNVKVLAIDQKASDDENKPQIVRAVTLELDLQQAELLMNARSRGDIQLALRNPNEQTEAIDEQTALEEAPADTQLTAVKEDSAVKETVIDTALAKTASVNVPRIVKKSQKVEVIRGVKKESIQLRTNDKGLQK